MKRFDWSQWLQRLDAGPLVPGGRTFVPQADSLSRCPECGGPAAVGLRGDGILNLRCATHGSHYAVPPLGLEGPLVDRLPRRARMNPEERLWMLAAACADVLSLSENGAFLVVDAQQHPCEYLILQRPDDPLVLEVGSREWDCPDCGNRPLPGSAQEALRDMGFEPGGHLVNPWRAHVPDDPTALAVLVERALTAAYDLPGDFEVVIYPGDRAACLRVMQRLSGRTPL